MPAATIPAGAAWAHLEQLRANVEAAQARVGELQSQRRHAVVALERVRGAQRSYYEEVGAGERDPDPGVEAQLAADVQAVQGDLTLRHEVNAGDHRVVAVDERAEALLGGSQRALDEARWEVEQFVVVEFDTLAAELHAEGLKATAGLQVAYGQLAAARRPYLEVRRRWAQLFAAADLPVTLPPDPLRGAGDDLENGRVHPPTPDALNPDHNQEDSP